MKKKKSIKDIISYSEIKKGQLVGGILFVSLGMLLSICPILVIYKVIKSLFLYGKLEQSAMQFCIYGLVAVVLAYCLTYIGSILCHKFSYVLIANLKKKILFHIGNLPLGFFTGDNKSKIRQVLGSDMNQIEGYFSHQLPNLISTLTLILAMIIVMLKINLILGLTTLLIIFVGLGIQIAIMARIIKSGGLEKNFAILDQINSATTEYVKGMPEVKIFGTGTKSFKTFSKSVGEYRDFTSSMTSMIRPGFVSFRMFILSVATFIVPVGILLMSRNNNLDFATVFIFYLILAPAISVPALKLRDFAEGMNLLNEVVLRVHEIIDQKELAIENSEEAIKGHDLEFNNVSFSYGNEEVLKNISFCAKQGEVTALVGYSGAGKSTIGTLIPRFYDPSEGSIKIGGVNMENTSVHSLADEISPLTLAFVGDGVYDLLVREYLVRKANRSVGELNKIKVSLVNCKSQAQFAKILMPELTEKEFAVYKRGRNAAPKCTPKNGSVADYHSATGLEALFGYLQINKEFDRINQLFEIIIHTRFGE